MRLLASILAVAIAAPAAAQEVLPPPPPPPSYEPAPPLPTPPPGEPGTGERRPGRERLPPGRRHPEAPRDDRRGAGRAGRLPGSAAPPGRGLSHWRYALATGVVGKFGGMQLSDTRENPGVLLYFGAQADGLWTEGYGQAARLRLRMFTGGETEVYIPSDGDLEAAYMIGRREFRFVIGRFELGRYPALGDRGARAARNAAVLRGVAVARVRHDAALLLRVADRGRVGPLLRRGAHRPQRGGRDRVRPARRRDRGAAALHRAPPRLRCSSRCRATS